MDENNKRSIVAIVVTYNRKDLLRKCITNILNQTVKCDVILVDNNSTDGTKEMVISSFSNQNIKYINTGANLGGSGGNSVGMKRAIQDGYKYLWIMDDDTIPENNALEKLLQAGDELNGEWGCLGSVVKWIDGSMCKANRQKKTIYTFVSDNEIKNKKIIGVQMTSFVSMLLKADVVRDVGLPKKEYIIWTDDYEYSGRISKKYPIYVVTKSIVRHEMKENKKPNFAIETPDRIDRYKYLYRNDVDCYRQFGIKGWLYIILKDCIATINVLLNSKEDKKKKVFIIWSSFIEGLDFSPEVEIINDKSIYIRS